MSKKVRTGNLPKGSYGGHVQALAPSLTDNQVVTIAVASNRSTALNAEIYRIAANIGCYISFGDNTVVATTSDMYFPAGAEVFVKPETATNVAVIRETTDGILTVTAMGDN